MSKRSRALDISPAVKRKVWARDGGCCIICGSPQAMPNSHYIKRSQGGLGIEQNISTMCARCHYEYDFGSGEIQQAIALAFRDYLAGHYPGWNEADLYYKKYKEV